MSQIPGPIRVGDRYGYAPNRGNNSGGGSSQANQIKEISSDASDDVSRRAIVLRLTINLELSFLYLARGMTRPITLNARMELLCIKLSQKSERWPRQET